MLLSKANFQVRQAVSSDPLDKALNGLFVDIDGTTVGTDKEVWVAVGPVNEELVRFPIGRNKPKTVGAGFVLRTEQVDQVIKNIPKDKGGVQCALLTECDDPNKIELTTISRSGMEQKAAMPPMFGAYPDWREVLRLLRGTNPTKICLNRKHLMNLLSIIESACSDKSGQNIVWIEINEETTGLVVRSENPETGQRVIGGIRAYNVDKSNWLSFNFWEQRVFGLVRKLLKRRE